MTAITTVPITAPIVSNLVVTSTIKGNALSWDNPAQTDDSQKLLFEVEIWVATTNNRSTATKLFATNGDSYLHVLTPGTTRYYWIIGNNIYGRTDGAWFPVSSTAGITNTSDLVITTDVTADAITDTTIIGSTTPTSFTSANYGEIENIMSVNFTGSGYPTEFFYTSDYSSDSRLATSGVIRISQIYTLTNTSSGGAEATSTAPVFGSSGVYNTGSQAVWTNITNAETVDATYASITNTGVGLEAINFYNFDFASIIPSGSTLIDMELIVKGYASGGTGTPRYNVSLTFDGADFATNYTSKYMVHWYAITLSGANTEYNRGYNVPFVADTKTNSCKHWTASWREYADTASVDAVDVYLPIDMSYITDSNFGVVIQSDASYTSGTYYLDYVGIKIRYTTEDVVYQSFQHINDNVANDDYVEAKNVNPTNRVLETLVDGDSYNYRVDHIRHIDDTVTDGGLVGTSFNRLLSIREFKR